MGLSWRVSPVVLACIVSAVAHYGHACESEYGSAGSLSYFFRVLIFSHSLPVTRVLALCLVCKLQIAI